MAYGASPYGTFPLGAYEGRDGEKNVVNVPTSQIMVSAPVPIAAVEYQYTTRKYNALERRSPCPT